MYPKTNFQDTVFRIERLCHSKRMNVALSVWRDEALGLSTGGKDSDDSDSEDESATAGRIKDTGFSTEAENVPSSRPASVPPSDVEDIDDFDIDAVLEAEERARIAAQSNLANVSSSASAAGDKRIENSNMDVDGDDDDEIWKIIDSTQQAPTAKNQPYAPSGRPSGVGGHDIDDEEMWDLASEMNLDPLKPDKSARVPLAEDTGEDMYV
ncbi:hypothetical protein AX16_004789 [Volvariella volvacea WC 439]|nr:hypothetical protein AX16_004789 [Volvariella volvacea WC 439]